MLTGALEDLRLGGGRINAGDRREEGPAYFGAEMGWAVGSSGEYGALRMETQRAVACLTWQEIGMDRGSRRRGKDGQSLKYLSMSTRGMVRACRRDHEWYVYGMASASGLLLLHQAWWTFI